jgi:DNA-binding PadR family transcriptional regulator
MLEQVKRLGINGAEPGGLYRYLRAMEREELVSSWWEPSQSGPARRTYELTRAGHEALRASIESLRDVRALLVKLLARYDALVPPVGSDGQDGSAARPQAKVPIGATMKNDS